MKINLKVQPKSGRQEIIRVDEDSYKVFLKKSPEDNKANEELTKLLKKYFNEKNVKIIKGLTSRNKIIEVN